MSDLPFDMPDKSHSFEDRGGWLVRRLAAEFELAPHQAAGIVGNLGFESGGLMVMQEIGITPPHGGWGWAQWTGPRRRAFEQWSDDRKWKRDSDKANYGFLMVELRGAYRRVVEKLRSSPSVADAVFVFGHDFEAPGGTTATRLPGADGRLDYAVRALDAEGVGTKPRPSAYTRTDCARDMQTALAKLGLYTAKIDGDWGDRSRAAYAAFLEGVR